MRRLTQKEVEEVFEEYGYKVLNSYKNNRTPLRIPYWEFDNIENILEKELKL